MIRSLRDKSYRNAGVLADCLGVWTNADTPEAWVVCLRVAETMNLIRGALKGK